MHPFNRKLMTTLMFTLVVSAVAQAQTSAVREEIQVLRPFELSKAEDRVHGPAEPRGIRHRHVAPDARGNVRKRTEYGKGFRYGRSVQGAQGDITILSPVPDNSYGKPPRPRFGPREHEEVTPRSQ